MTKKDKGKIVTVPDEVLRKKTEKVITLDKRVQTLIDKMINTLQSQKDPEGVGLAAPQVGVNKRIFVAKIGDDTVTFINPKIIKRSKERETLLEGCLSIPKYYGILKRSVSVTVEGLDRSGKKVRKTYKGFPARIIQHEMDHLNGVLYVDKVLSQKGKIYEVEGEHLHEVEI